jgi:hypothetical protein
MANENSDEQPVRQELIGYEFLAYDGTALYGASLNQNWYLVPGNKIRSFPLSPLIRKRKLYVYIWGDTSATYSFYATNFDFLFKGQRVARIPVGYFWLDSTNVSFPGGPGGGNLSNEAGDGSRISLAVSGGLFGPDCIQVFQNYLMSDLTLNPESGPVTLQPRYLDFKADRLEIDLQHNLNLAPNSFRFLFVLSSQ